MRFLLLSILAVLFWASTWSQETVVIKNIKFYQEGKVNILKSPSGKRTIVTLKSDWKEHDEVDTSLYWDKEKRKLKPEFDSTLPSPSPLPIMALLSNVIYSHSELFKSYIDPNLTQTQRDNIQANECKNSKFAGLSRSKVKTSIVSGSANTFNGLQQFLNTLPSDVDMEHVIDSLDRPWRDRAIQEQKKVTVKNIFLKAYNREKDNDYHLILCDAGQTIFFNAEVSALPGNSVNSFQTLRNVRNKFEAFPGERKCGGKYVQFDPPIKILQLRGSIFFDSDHPAGQVGPAGAKPNTAWEIHPITFIQFE
jgi:hypothetical protein